MTADQKTGESVRDRPCRACAHCGSEATFPYLTDTGVAWYVNCNHCGARSAAHQHQWQAIAAWNQRPDQRAGAGEWVDIRKELPPIDEVVECACVSGYDGSLYRQFGARFHADDGWLWSMARGWDLSEADDDGDDYCVAFWRRPTVLPDAKFDPKVRNGRPTPYPEVNDPPTHSRGDGEAG